MPYFQKNGVNANFASSVVETNIEDLWETDSGLEPVVSIVTMILSHNCQLSGGIDIDSGFDVSVEVGIDGRGHRT